MDRGDLTAAEYRSLAEFRYSIRRFLRFSEEAARTAGLEPQQHQALLTVEALTGVAAPSVSEIADFLMIRHHSAVGLLDRLEERGLLERQRATEDRRQVLMRLTQAGEEILRGLSLKHREELMSSGRELVNALQELLERAAAGSAV